MTNNHLVTGGLVTGELVRRADYLKTLTNGSVIEIVDRRVPNLITRVVVNHVAVGQYVWLSTPDGDLIELDENRSVYLVSAPPIIEPTRVGSIVLLKPKYGCFSYIVRLTLDGYSFSPWRFPDMSPAHWADLSKNNRIASVLSYGAELPPGAFSTINKHH